MLLAFVAGLSGLELFLRTTGASAPPFARADTLLGYARIPGASVVYYSDGMRIDRVNWAGLLGPNVAKARKAGVLRVALVGDSFVEGLQLPDPATVRGILERSLRERTGAPVQVIDLGFKAFHFMDFWLVARTLAREWAPDVTLITLRGASFVQDPRRLGPWYYLSGDSIGIDRSFIHSRRYIVGERLSALRRFGLYSLCFRAQWNFAGGWWKTFVFGKAARWVGLVERRFFREQPGKAPVTLDRELVNRVLDDYARWNQEGSLRIVLVDGGDVDPATIDAARRRGLPMIRVGSALDALRARGIDPNFWKAVGFDEHWNAAGQRAVARELARSLLSDGDLPVGRRNVRRISPRAR